MDPKQDSNKNCVLTYQCFNTGMKDSMDQDETRKTD